MASETAIRTPVPLTHLGRNWHKLPSHVYTVCQPISYLKRIDFVPRFEDDVVVTCLECIVMPHIHKGDLRPWQGNVP